MSAGGGFNPHASLIKQGREGMTCVMSMHGTSVIVFLFLREWTS